VQIRSDINYRIERLFRDRGIRIPYPTQEFLLKNVHVSDLRDPDLFEDDRGEIRSQSRASHQPS
jgi:small-conductance mechanosensitive channel